MIFGCFVNNSFAQSLESLSEKINYGDTEQRRDALLQIKTLKTAEASRLAIPLLSDSSEIVRATAVTAIIYLPSDEAVNQLLPLLKDKSEIIRRETIYALGKIRNPNAINPLIEISQTDKILEVQNFAIIALGEIGDIAAVDFLNEVLQKKIKDEEDFSHRAAARSIGQIAKFIQIKQTETVTPTSFLPEKYKVTENIKHSNLSEKFPTFRNAVNILISILQSSKDSQDVKRESAFALGEIADESAVTVLQSNLNNEDYYLAEICKEALKKIKLD